MAHSTKMTKWGTIAISVFQMRKRMLKTKSSDNDQIVRISRRSTLSDQEYELWWYDSWFTDMFSKESSELSSEPEESTRNLVPLTEIFQIIPSQIYKNLTFPHMEQFNICWSVFSRRDQKLNLCFYDWK